MAPRPQHWAGVRPPLRWVLVGRDTEYCLQVVLENKHASAVHGGKRVGMGMAWDREVSVLVVSHVTDFLTV